MQLAKTEIQHIVEALVLAGRGTLPHAKRRRNERLLKRLNREWLAATLDKPGADMQSKALVELTWKVSTLDTSTNCADDECGAIEVSPRLLRPENRAKLRKLILEDFDERGTMFEDWAYGDQTTVEVELPDIGWETI